MSSVYDDANYLFKLLCLEPGSNEVRARAATTRFIDTAALGRAEFASATQSPPSARLTAYGRPRAKRNP